MGAGGDRIHRPRASSRARRLAAGAALEEQQPRQLVVLAARRDHLACEHLDGAAALRTTVVEGHLHDVVGDDETRDPHGGHVPSLGVESDFRRSSRDFSPRVWSKSRLNRRKSRLNRKTNRLDCLFLTQHAGAVTSSTAAALTSGAGAPGGAHAGDAGAAARATVDCLVERGFAGTSTTLVSERAGVSRGAGCTTSPPRTIWSSPRWSTLTEKRGAELAAAAARLPQGRRRTRAVLEMLADHFTGAVFQRRPRAVGGGSDRRDAARRRLAAGAARRPRDAPAHRRAAGRRRGRSRAPGSWCRPPSTSCAASASPTRSPTTPAGADPRPLGRPAGPAAAEGAG